LPDNEQTPGDPLTSSLRAVILDYGDVISLPADPAVMSWMAAVFQVPLDRFRRTYSDFRHDYDRGALEAAEYWQKIGEANGVTLDAEQIAQLRKADVTMWGRLNPVILHWAKELRLAGFKTAVLSNMHADMIEHLQQNGEWTKSFDYLTLSSKLGMAKPEPEIFQHCLKGLGVSAGEAMFIDDRDVNIEAAVRLGIAGIVAPNTEALVDLLEAIGFSPVPVI
jgi:putative hydrolase of the HAD superfamily